MKFIDTADGFAGAAERILRAPWAAVDTEADSLHHYAEKLSLVQISIPEEDYVIDPLAPVGLEDFLPKLARMDLIFHAADSDVRLLKKTGPFSPRRIFDTMLAAQILGYEKIGLQSLAEKHCGIKLSKTEQKADWSRRPLEEKLIRYAANDTHYLRTISEAMRLELQEKGRLEWHRQQCAKLLETLDSLRPVEDEDRPPAWQIKGAKNLKGKALTYLKELWQWRDDLARQKDRPAFKVLNAEYLIEIAQWASQNPGRDLGEWKEAPRNVRNEHRAALNALLKRADSLPQAALELPARKGPRIRWTDRETQLLSDLKAVRDEKAKELAVHPSLIATNAVLETLSVQKPRDAAALNALGLLLPWQVEVAGQGLLKALEPPKGTA